MNIDEVRDSVVLMLTASIDTKNVWSILRDPKERQRQYKDTLRHYLEKDTFFRKILFVENSGWPLDELKKDLENPTGKEIEYLSLDCNDFPNKFTKGYGEFVMMRQALDRSELLANSKYFAKLTGRLTLKNPKKILLNLAPGSIVLCDFKGMVKFKKTVFFKKHPDTFRDHCDTRFIVFETDFFRREFELGLSQHSEGPFYVETRFYDRIKDLLDQGRGGIHTRFPVEPRFSGVSGHFSTFSYSGLRERFRCRVGDILRKIFPRLYF